MKIKQPLASCLLPPANRFLLPALAILLLASGYIIFSSNANEPAYSPNNLKTDTMAMYNDQTVMAVLYQQRTGEYRAQCYQAYKLAKMLVQEDYSKPSVPSNKAIVLDIDETILDNSPFQAACVQQNVTFPKLWDEWVGKASAEVVPGAVDFLNFAKSKSYQIFYITNRDEKQKDATLRNMIAKGFPMADERHLIMKKDISSKESRRKQLMVNYHLSLLIGDNLNDFTYIFEKKSADDRIHLTDSLQAEFGQRFIVLPNAMYGDWESGLYPDYNKQTLGIKWHIRRSMMKGF
jgi:5'-nucleotidase (lipoprotein e(P4) family)